MEYIQTIAILKYNQNLPLSPRDNVISKNYETTDEDLETEDKPALRTHRVRTAKYSKIQYTGPTHQKFVGNLFSLVYLDAENQIQVTN